MNPEKLYYTKDHEWARIEGNIAVVGITDHAQESLGEVTFVELPKIGQELSAHAQLGSVESSKAASDIYSPVKGKITEVNQLLASQPELLNKDCYGAGWICKMQIAGPDAAQGLMSSKQYEDYLAGL